MDWFRSVHGAPTHKKWLAVARRAQQPVPVVVAVAWALMDYASRQADRGSIDGFDVDDLAAYLALDEVDVDAVVGALEEKGWLVNDRIASWDQHQTKREDASAKRVQAWRERKATQGNADVTQRNAPERDTDTDTETISNEIVVAQAPAKPSKAKPTHWPEDAIVPDDWRAWGRERRPEVDVDLEAEKFANHWPQKQDKSGLRTNWNKTWRNWILGARSNGKRDHKPSERQLISDIADQIDEARGRSMGLDIRQSDIGSPRLGGG